MSESIKRIEEAAYVQAAIKARDLPRHLDIIDPITGAPLNYAWTVNFRTVKT